MILLLFLLIYYYYNILSIFREEDISVKDKNASRNIVNRFRQRLIPKVPENMFLLPAVIDQYQSITNYYQGHCVTDNNDSVALFFSSPFFWEKLNEVPEIHVATSYKVLSLKSSINDYNL